MLMEGDESPSFQSIDRLRALIEETDFPGVGKVTLSAGVAPINPEQPSVRSIDHADQALYEAKRSGRNQVVMSSVLEDDEEMIQEGELTLF